MNTKFMNGYQKDLTPILTNTTIYGVPEWLGVIIQS